MAIIEPVKQDPANPALIKKNSAALRFWHWANTIIISGLLITVLINATILDDRSNQSFLKTELQKGGTILNAKQAQTLAHAQSDEVWGIHAYFGYFLAALFVFRLILEFFQPKEQRFFMRIKEAYQQYFVIKQNQYLAKHDFVVRIIYLGFYLLLLVMVVTGLTLAFEDELAALKPIRHAIKEVHGFCMYLVLAFVAVHLVGVILAERDRSPGIVSDMINGGNKDKA
jgi:Ni/Fe-hydrogenase 1 B-type cytochrome subunit